MVILLAGWGLLGFGDLGCVFWLSYSRLVGSLSLSLLSISSGSLDVALGRRRTVRVIVWVRQELLQSQSVHLLQ